jgi:hypothetical protein
VWTYWNRTIPPPKTGKKGSHFANWAKRFSSISGLKQTKEQQSSATEELTLKKESPGPKMIDGLMIVLSGFSFKKAFSPCSLVRQLYIISSDPLSLSSSDRDFSVVLHSTRLDSSE